jgi:hypothetical protein
MASACGSTLPLPVSLMIVATSGWWKVVLLAAAFTGGVFLKK